LRIAIFGGTFDPIHSAHLTVAREAARTFRLDRVLFVPASCPPHKGRSTWAGYEDRFRMVEIAIRGEPGFEASRLEAAQGRSYSVSTIEKVRATLGAGDELFFLIGADAFAEIETWYRWKDVVRSVEFIVVTRPGHGYLVPPGAKVHTLETLALPTSSSDIRARLARGESPEEVPPEVLGYLRERALYAGPA
jgi:nicotinate-nucleotide adenylyltransferase